MLRNFLHFTSTTVIHNMHHNFGVKRASLNFFSLINILPTNNIDDKF